MPTEITAALRAEGIEIIESSDLAAAVASSDVLYMNRVQKERFTQPEDYERLKSVYQVDAALIANAKHGMTIMHPLPRAGELSRDVDEMEGVAYFRQAYNGVPIRMALLALVTGNE